jgi:hypothetical protein
LKGLPVSDVPFGEIIAQDLLHAGKTAYIRKLSQAVIAPAENSGGRKVSKAQAMSLIKIYRKARPGA